MEKLYGILNSIAPNNDYLTDDKLIDSGHLASLSLLTLVSELEDEFGIEITPVDLVPENFNSAKAMWAMIERLRG